MQTRPQAAVVSESENKAYWVRVRAVGFSLLISPVILFVVGYLLHRSGFRPLVQNYEEGIARMVQYVLFGIGVGIFLFCDGVSNFLAQRLFASQGFSGSKEGSKDNLAGYLTYVVVMMSLLNVIGIMGFLGFLICANIAWLTVFVLLDISIEFKYFPSAARFHHLLSLLKQP